LHISKTIVGSATINIAVYYCCCFFSFTDK